MKSLIHPSFELGNGRLTWSRSFGATSRTTGRLVVQIAPGAPIAPAWRLKARGARDMSPEVYTSEAAALEAEEASRTQYGKLAATFESLAERSDRVGGGVYSTRSAEDAATAEAAGIPVAYAPSVAYGGKGREETPRWTITRPLHRPECEPFRSGVILPDDAFALGKTADGGVVILPEADTSSRGLLMWSVEGDLHGEISDPVGAGAVVCSVERAGSKRDCALAFVAVVSAGGSVRVEERTRSGRQVHSWTFGTDGFKYSCDAPAASAVAVDRI